MGRNTIREWLEAHPTIAGYVFVAGIYLVEGSEIVIQGAGEAYKGP